jgi:hypothetical protein
MRHLAEATIERRCGDRHYDEENAMTTAAAPFPVEETSIAALHAAYLSGRATAASVCRAHLDRIAAYDRKGPALGAIIITNPGALADAASLDAHLASSRSGGPSDCGGG